MNNGEVAYMMGQILSRSSRTALRHHLLSRITNFDGSLAHNPHAKRLNEEFVLIATEVLCE